ncbi:hypothetical protein AB0H77_21790 [Streptomyces sp. NPDC050844]|uniref:hypothetical protein n=1 Tax=Streptomyces sp. NPDC050844 TaxID=3155790 RepID=UPI0033DB0CBE
MRIRTARIAAAAALAAGCILAGAGGGAALDGPLDDPRDTSVIHPSDRQGPMIGIPQEIASALLGGNKG